MHHSNQSTIVGIPLGGLLTTYHRRLARQVGVCVLIPMANQMVHVPSSLFSLYLGQSLTVGSISCVINAEGEGEIVETV